MSRRLFLVLAPALVLATAAAPALGADEICGGVTLPQGAACEVVEGEQCAPRCGTASYLLACAARLQGVCAGSGAGGAGGAGGEGGSGGCAQVDEACVPLREADCLNACAVGPVDCAGYCSSACQLDCEANRCAGDPSSLSCAVCAATCRGTCAEACASPPADCAGLCAVAARGSCLCAEYLDAQDACQQSHLGACADELSARCRDRCAGGLGEGGAGGSPMTSGAGSALFCGDGDGDYIDTGARLQECVDSLSAQGVTITLVTGPAPCEGSDCAAAEPELPAACTPCAAGGDAPAPTPLALLLLALLRRRRSRR